MMLSPLLRTWCFALVSGGILQLMLEALTWRLTPLADEFTSARSPRLTERSLLAATISARILPWMLTCGVLVPAYLRGEDNQAAEHVALPCIAAAVVVGVSIAATILRAMLTSLRTRHYCRRCQPGQRTIAGLQVQVHRGSRSLLAVAGIFRSRLIVSEHLLEGDHVAAPALEVALTHEAAHAAHRDNLKLLALALLPRIPIATTARPSLDARWRLAAELAADEESTRGDAHRCLLLAELLVLLARDRSNLAPTGMVTLLSAPDHLRIRVERLLRATMPAAPHAPLPSAMPLTLVALSLGLLSLAGACVLVGHRAAELLLHLG